MHDKILLITAACYLSAVILLYAAVAQGSSQKRKIAAIFTFSGVMLHIWAEVQHWLIPASPQVSLLNALSLCALVTVAIPLTTLPMRKNLFDASLVALPLAMAVGALILGTRPTLGVLVVFEIVRRAGNYAFVKPARETLFTLVDRNVRYKAKSFIDTFVYRGGDALGALGFKLLGVLGIGTVGTALVTVPLALIWGGVGFFLGRRQSRLAGEDD